MNDLMEEIQLRVEQNERVLVTLTKRMAEELTEYLAGNNIRCNPFTRTWRRSNGEDHVEELRGGLFDG